MPQRYWKNAPLDASSKLANEALGVQPVRRRFSEGLNIRAKLKQVLILPGEPPCQTSSADFLAKRMECGRLAAAFRLTQALPKSIGKAGRPARCVECTKQISAWEFRNAHGLWEFAYLGPRSRRTPFHFRKLRQAAALHTLRVRAAQRMHSTAFSRGG
jgi:hypothetical protein